MRYGPSENRKRTHDEQVKGVQFVSFFQLRKTLSFIKYGYLPVMAKYLIYDTKPRLIRLQRENKLSIVAKTG